MSMVTNAVQQNIKPTISVIIPVYDDEQHLMRCLDALNNQTLSKEKYEVIVVDNGSSKPLHLLISRYTFARCILETTPGSYAARNKGIECAIGDYLAFTDADCIPSADWLLNAVTHLRHNPHTMIIGGSVNLLYSPCPTSAELFEKMLGFKQEQYITELGFSVTANLIVRKKAFDQVGAFNSELYSGGDNEWGRRANNHGLQIEYEPNIAVWHEARKSIRSLIRKHRRTTGGLMQAYRNQFPRLFYCLMALRPQIPIRRSYNLILNRGKYDLTYMQSLRVAGILQLLAAVGYLEKVRLLLGGKPRRK